LTAAYPQPVRRDRSGGALAPFETEAMYARGTPAPHCGAPARSRPSSRARARRSPACS